MPDQVGTLMQCVRGRAQEGGTPEERAVFRPTPNLFLPRVRPTSYTLYPMPYTLHPTPYTLHPTPYTLHPPPYTLRPTPYALHHNP